LPKVRHLSWIRPTILYAFSSLFLLELNTFHFEMLQNKAFMRPAITVFILVPEGRQH